MILLIFITKSEQLNEYINSGKTIYPESYVEKRMESAISRSYLCKNGSDATSSVEKEIGLFLDKIDGFIVFCDNAFYDEIGLKLGCSTLLSKLGDYNNFLDGSVKTKQYLEDNITLALKVYFWIKESFINGFGEILRLPIRNFNDSDFKKTCHKISEILSKNNIPQEMDELSRIFSTLKKKLESRKEDLTHHKSFMSMKKVTSLNMGKSYMRNMRLIQVKVTI